MRPTDVPDQGLLCDLLWSDPDKDTNGWGENDRGVSFTFGVEVRNSTTMQITRLISATQSLKSRRCRGGCVVEKRSFIEERFQQWVND